MASAVRLSPSANLLRKSRIFAIPQPLKPPTPPTSSTASAPSDDATLPYPVHQSIETTPSSLARGDWGLKRALPAKSTSQKSSNPVIRINGIDTIEHVTDFDSAADHTMTLYKIQELNLPMSLHTESTRRFLNVRGTGAAHRSPFDMDNISRSAPREKRWKFTGPWISGMSDLEFANYIKSLQKNKPKFKEALWKEYAQEAEGKSQATSEEGYQEFVKKLRNDMQKLEPIVANLLDLAPTMPTEVNTRKAAQMSAAPTSKFAFSGAPKTHPAAGLSYVRTRSHITNHPAHGPQDLHAPVIARVLAPKKRVGKVRNALLGVHGIVTEFHGSESASTGLSGREDGISGVDPDVEGGSKIWVEANSLSINADGKLKLDVTRADPALMKYWGIEDESKQRRHRAVESFGPSSRIGQFQRTTPTPSADFSKPSGSIDALMNFTP